LEKTVIHVSPFSTPHSGGFISSLKSLVAYAKTKKFRVVLIFPEAARNTRWACQMLAEGYIVYFLPPNQSMVAIVKIIKGIAEIEKAKIIHTHFSNYNFPASIAALLINWKKEKVRTIWHFHSDWRIRLTLVRRIKDFILFKLLGHYVYGISVSEDIKENIVSRGMPRERIYYVPNGFDINRVISSTKTSAAIRRELGIPEGKTVFLAFGWAPITKGVDLLLAAFEAFAMQSADVVLFLVGADAMKQYIEQWTCGTRRDWLVLSEPRENVADFYKASDVFVSASRSEGFPYSVTEAMAAKLPIVSSDIPALTWARNVEGVVFFESCNVDSLVQAVQTVIEWSEEDRIHKTLANSTFVDSNYSLDKWDENIIKTYISILGDTQ
jgi:glycosyltransferase involved in cell wall biosynthesis